VVSPRERGIKQNKKREEDVLGRLEAAILNKVYMEGSTNFRKDSKEIRDKVYVYYPEEEHFRLRE
jgi:hypothetical protein